MSLAEGEGLPEAAEMLGRAGGEPGADADTLADAVADGCQLDVRVLGVRLGRMSNALSRTWPGSGAWTASLWS